MDIIVIDRQPVYTFGGEAVNVIVNGTCNHAEAITEQNESWPIGAYDKPFMQQVEVCPCGAWRTPGETWNDEVENER